MHGGVRRALPAASGSEATRQSHAVEGRQENPKTAEPGPTLVCGGREIRQKGLGERTS